jgi:hypothetical protein
MKKFTSIFLINLVLTFSFSILLSVFVLGLGENESGKQIVESTSVAMGFFGIPYSVFASVLTYLITKLGVFKNE